MRIKINRETCEVIGVVVGVIALVAAGLQHNELLSQNAVHHIELIDRLSQIGNLREPVISCLIPKVQNHCD